MLLLAACSDSLAPVDPNEPGGGGGGTTTEDKTPVNVELNLSFDGESPEIAFGPDGTLHMVYRVAKGPSASVWYTKKAADDYSWAAPVEVIGATNASYRWFNHPQIAVGQDNRVHFAWGPEPYDHNGTFYSSCMVCDGSDFRGRASGNATTQQVTDDRTEWVELGVTDSGEIHVAVSQLYRRRQPSEGGGAFDTKEQMVHYLSNDGGETWQQRTIVKPSYTDLSMAVDGETVHLMMRFRSLMYSRFVTNDQGVREWQNSPIPTKGYGISEMNPLPNGNGLAGFVYSSWGTQWPEAIWFDVPGSSAPVQLSTKETSFKPNNTHAARTEDGKILAMWADSDGYIHYNYFDGTSWTGDLFMGDKVDGISDPRMARAAIWEYFGAHGKIIWPVTTMEEHDGAFHLVFRASDLLDQDGLTVAGSLHYVKFVP